MTTRQYLMRISAALAKADQCDKAMDKAMNWGDYQNAREEKINHLIKAKCEAYRLVDALRIEIECEDI